jgi:hypothetical protein
MVPGVVSETMRSEEAQIDGLLTTSPEPASCRIADVH